MSDTLIVPRAVAVSPSTARRVLGMIDAFGSPERAAHEAEVQLRAIMPYGDARLERALEVLSLIARSKTDKQLNTVRAIAAREDS